MKPHTFFIKYANLPILTRVASKSVMMPDGNYQSISPVECYEEISKWGEKASEADRELKKWLELAEKILH